MQLNSADTFFIRGCEATGIEYTPNARFRPNEDPAPITALATRLVVISAGAFGSPGILERSGIGKKDVLANAGVEQLVDLPGVGEHYQGRSVMLAVSRRLTETLQIIKSSSRLISPRRTRTRWMVLYPTTQPKSNVSSSFSRLSANLTSATEWTEEWTSTGGGLMAHK